MMSYLNEVYKGQIYEVDGEQYEIIEIRATNVTSKYDFIIAVTFKNDRTAFDTRIEKVISNPVFKLI